MKAWEQLLADLGKKWGHETIDKWLRPLEVVQFDAGNLYLKPRDSFQASWFEEHVRPELKSRFLNNNGRPIQVHLTSPDVKKEIVKKQEWGRPFSLESDPLDPFLSLENFVVSPENEMAFRILSEGSFNPIYLYGPKQAGKTHLLMGAAREWQKKGKKVFYARAETFTEHVVQAMRLGAMREFRNVYRDIDALFIDDLHIFSRKNATQEEFFHTFNALHMAGKAIFLSANAPPSHLKEIEPRLISRFEWGIAIGIKKGEGRQILEKKASLWKYPLSEVLVSYLLEKFPKDPLLALQALILRGKGEMTPLLAERLLSDLLQAEERAILTPEHIIKALAAHFGLKSTDLLGKSQTRECALPRQIAMYACREKLKLPFQKIGEIFSRDHSTVMSSVKQVQKGIEEKKTDLLEALHSLET